MITHRSSLTRAAALAVAALALSAPLAACSDDNAADTSPATTKAPTSDASVTDDTAMDDEATDDTAMDDEASSGEIGTTELLDFLNAEDPEIGALFDWNTGDGLIGVNYMGTQTVGLYAVDIDVDTATAVCELASEYVFEVDETADLEVYTGGYDASVLVVSRSGATGTCTPA